MSDKQDVTFTVNGDERKIRVEPRRSLADALREDCGLTGTHLGCEHGVCGACTVLVDDKPVRSCLMFGCKPRALGCALSRGSLPATNCTRCSRRSGSITARNAASARRDF